MVSKGATKSAAAFCGTGPAAAGETRRRPVWSQRQAVQVWSGDEIGADPGGDSNDVPAAYDSLGAACGCTWTKSTNTETSRYGRQAATSAWRQRESRRK